MRHAVRIAVIWLVVSAIVEVLIGIVPIPSPTGSREALGEHQTVYMLFYVGAPIFVFIWVLLLYCFFAFRGQPDEGEEERPAPPDSSTVLLLWAALSFLIVLFLAGWGTFTLHEITSPPSPPVVSAKTVRHGGGYTALIAKGSNVFNIQVIGQQWIWTYRYPSFGGMETNTLYLPVDTPIQFHITSLDVVHSFWIYDYDVKEDAVPGVENTAYMLARTTGASTTNGKNWVVCNELCGLWHGYMRSKLDVISQSAFASWAKKQEAYEKSIGFLQNLPKYASVYYPTSNANWPPAPQDQSP